MEGSKSLIETMELLFSSKKGSDVTFVVHGKELQAHKIILTSRSSVFDAMINSNLKPEDGKHLINDPEITFEDFENFLKFLYTDDCSVTEENVEKLMHLSNFYNVQFLTDYCVQNIKRRFRYDNILRFAELGLLYSETCSLLDVCLKRFQYIIDDGELNYHKNEKWIWISPELTLKIVQNCPRNETFTEEFFFQKVYNWAKKSTKNRDEIKAALKPLMPYIAFADLEPYTLATAVRNNGIFNDSNFADIICKAVVKEKEHKSSGANLIIIMECSKSLIETMYSLFSTKKGSDVTFIVHGKELPAHKIILTSRSSVFDAMINSDLAPIDGKHLINDPEITFEDFENFLKFLYTDQCSVTDDNVEKLMHLGNFYNVPFLVEYCIQDINQKFRFHNVLKYAELGLLYSETCSLLDICLKKLQFFNDDEDLRYVKNEKWIWISPELALKIVEKCERNESFTEECLFQKIYRWASQNDDNENENKRNRDEIKAALKPLMPYIKFANLKLSTLATIVRENGIFDDANFADVICKAVLNVEDKRRTADEKQRFRAQNPPIVDVFDELNFSGESMQSVD